MTTITQAAAHFLPRADAPGVVAIINGAATPMSPAAAIFHRDALIRLGNACDRDAMDAADTGADDIATFHRGMADGFRRSAVEISRALVDQARAA